jgi:hypothetical protein
MTVLVANDDLTVIGGPTSIKVSMDIGATGKRGSQIFISPGKPNEVEIGQTPEVFDLCINTLRSDSEYLYMYQYQNLGAVNQWVALFNIIPDTFSTNATKIFADGQTVINVPVASITSTQNLTSTSFNIQHSIVSDNPVSSSISIGSIAIVDDTEILPITINAVEFVDDTWSLLVGTKVVHLAITVV